MKGKKITALVRQEKTSSKVVFYLLRQDVIYFSLCYFFEAQLVFPNIFNIYFLFSFKWSELISCFPDNKCANELVKEYDFAAFSLISQVLSESFFQQIKKDFKLNSATFLNIFL